MELTPDAIRWVLIGLFILLISVALHEFGHAIMADMLGDDTPRRQGRVTLNPLAHADPIGTFLLPLAGGLWGAAGGGGGGFGWGKPVQWQPHRIRRGISMSLANILVSFAGPFMNILLATFTALVHCILIGQGVQNAAVNQVLIFVVGTNFILFFFNLLPIPPLDGGHIAEAFMPYRYRSKFESYARYSPFLLLAVILIPQVRAVFAVPANWCTEHLYRAFLGIFA